MSSGAIPERSLPVGADAAVTLHPVAGAPGGEAPADPVGRTRGFQLIDRGLRASAAAPVDLPAGLLANMELSNLEFQSRVLDLAEDEGFPLLERVRYLSIFGSNLDEFFMTRVAGFQRQLATGNVKRTLDGMEPAEQLLRIRERVDQLLDRAYGRILPGLEERLRAHGVEMLRQTDLSDSDVQTLAEQYGELLFDLLIPVAVPSAGRFPHVRNLRPSLLVRLHDRDGGENLMSIALPDALPRLVALPGGRRFVSLEDVVRSALPAAFTEVDIADAHVFRVTRSGNISVALDGAHDVVEVVEETVARRRFAPAVRLEVEQAMPVELERFLLDRLAAEAHTRASRLDGGDVYRVDGLLDLKQLQIIASLPIDELRFPRPRVRSPFPGDAGFFDRIREGARLVQFPRHAFNATVGRFIREAADDPDVEEVRVTLYRTNPRSSVVRLVRRAHRRGKRVVVFVEVKASFEERRNIEWGRALEAEGIEVLYGPPTLKVHAKIALVRRREGGRLVTYSYIGTGNLNAATAAGYTDLGLFTADPEIGSEMIDIFEALADRPAAGEFRELIAAPFNMRQRFLGLISRETEHALHGRGGEITAKLNGIADREIIAALYDASRAGVRIDLVVRGICSLRPGVPGFSENIRVVANAGRYLEHSRIFRFANGGDPEYFIGSADWRGRNLSRRVEVVVPIRVELHRRVLDGILAERLNDPSAWELLPDAEYRRRSTAHR